ncbi:DNA-directed RNA polymerase [Lipomyces oligophaga]|uniref:DNA-directed RNA polymerase n=1 Tax=Lipomyces oligophaga TaxID=45792 RepID=UPI0034CEDCB2
MNQPDRFELFLLPDGMKKLDIVADARIPNAVNIKFEREDHTLGNLLRCALLQDPRVIYAAYKVEHPLFANFVLRLQTEPEHPPTTVLRDVIMVIISQLEEFKTEFIKEWELKRIADSDTY